MSQEGANNIVDGSYFSFSLTILRGGMGTRETKHHAMLFAKLVKVRVVIFSAIITLEGFNRYVKLCTN